MTLRHIIGTLVLVALDAVAGLVIGAFAAVLVLLIWLSTGYTWIFAIALALVLVSTGVADRFLLPNRKDATPASARVQRRLAFCVGLACGVWSVVSRSGLSPGGSP